jgi:tetratricopeptide (TPR) repeat protein
LPPRLAPGNQHAGSIPLPQLGVKVGTGLSWDHAELRPAWNSLPRGFVLIITQFRNRPLSKDFDMTKPRIHFGILGAVALLSLALLPGQAFAIGGETASPPPQDSKAKSKKKQSGDQKQDKKSQNDFLDGYKAARALVLDGKYEDGIKAFHALGHDSHPDVANYLGYASRKMGQYDKAKYWYEAALASDPKHTRTWQYYGLWHLEQGNRLKAEDHLEKIQLICGNRTCDDYTSLKAALEGQSSSSY